MTLEHQGLSPAEIALLEGDDLDETGAPKETDDERAAAAAVANSQAGDADDDEPPAAAPAAPAPPAAAPAAPAPAPAPAPATAADDLPTEPAPAPPPAATYDAGNPAEFDAREAAITATKAEAMKKLMDGEIDADAYAELEAKATSDLMQLTRDRTLHTANLQQEQRAQEATISRLMADGAKQGINYKDAGLGALFDAKLQALAAKPEHAGKTFHQLADAAHAEVLTLFGKKPGAPAAAPAPAPTQQTTRQPVDMSTLPPTLSRVPPAADPNIAGDEFAHLANLSGADLEKAVARMTPEQQERWLG